MFRNFLECKLIVHKFEVGTKWVLRDSPFSRSSGS